MLLACLLSGALAADAGYPYALHVAGEGRSLRLLDVQGREIPTADALVFVGDTEAAAAYRSHRTAKKAGSIALWIAGGAVIVGSAALGMEGYTGTTPDLYQLGSYAGAAMIGTGFLVRFVDGRRNLGAWTDAGGAVAAVDAHNAAFLETPLQVRDLAAAEREFARLQLYMTAEGQVVDVHGEPIGMGVLTERLGDDEMRAAWRRARRVDKVVWISTTAVGGGIAAIGGLVGFVGFVISDLGGYGDGLLTAGGAAFLVGGAGVGVGVGGLVVSKRRHDDPATWYDAPTLKREVGAYDQRLRGELGLPPPTSWLQVRPVLMPGGLGVVGTF